MILACGGRLRVLRWCSLQLPETILQKSSFKLDPESVSVGQNIDFIATLTNTTDQPIILRKPLQEGVIEALYADTTLLFSVEPLSEGPSFEYPLEGRIFRLTKGPMLDEFVTLAPHTSYETRLQLPHIVDSLEVADVQFPLPAGQYRVHMTCMNDAIGHEVNVGDHSRYADLNAWVGEVVADPVVLTILPSE